MKFLDRLFSSPLGVNLEPDSQCSIIGTTAAIIGATVASAAGGIASSAIGSSAANKAANAQVAASNYAADKNAEAAKQALDFQKQQWLTSLGLSQPWLQAGTSGIYNLSNLLGLNIPTNANTATSTPAGTVPLSMLSGNEVPTTTNYPNDINIGKLDSNPDIPIPDTTGQATGTTVPTANTPAGPNPADYINPALGEKGSLLAPWTEQFTAPTDVTEQNDPGYQFRLNEGMKALQRSAAAKGNLLTGGTAKALTRYGQDYASNEYGNVYSRAWNEYANRYNVFQNNQANQFNRLAALSGVGQTTANQLGTLGQNNANNVSNILLGSANAQGNAAQNAAAARASGYVGGANAWSGALGGIGGNLSNALLLSSLMGGSGGSGTTIPTWVGAGLGG